MLKRLTRAVRRHGLVGVLKLVPRSAQEVLKNVGPARRRARRNLVAFDRRHGVDTAASIEVSALDMPSHIAATAVRYQPLSQIEKYLKELPIDFEQYLFVDYGCGKGNALFLAAEFPFREIIGVECSHKLVEIARLNLERYNSRTQRCKLISVIEGDAARFCPPDGPMVYFLYNPFGQAILQQVMVQIRRAHADQPHVNYLIYVTPRHRSSIEAEMEWTIIADHSDWVIYRSSDGSE
jgi:SAM-dependent methyltransferase